MKKGYTFIIVIVLSCLIFGIVLYKNHNNTIKGNSLNDQALRGLNYTIEDIDILKKNVSKDNIQMIINQVYERDMIIPIVTNKDYKDEYLSKYIKYHLDNQELEYDVIVIKVNENK